MAGLFDRIKTAYESRGETEDWQKVKDAISPTKAMKKFENRGERIPEPTSIQKRIKKDISKPVNTGAASAPSIVSTKKARQSIAKPSDKAKSNIVQASTPSLNAMETIPRNLGTPERSPIFNKARENLQKGFDMSAFSSPHVKDPVTGNLMERAGYHNEAGTFIPEQRLAVKDVGPMFSYLASSVRNPELHKTLLEGLMEKAGVTPETEGMGAGFNRALEERLTRSKLASAENIANIQAQSGIEEASLLSGGRIGAAEAKSGTTIKPKWKQAADDTWYDENNPLPPPEQTEMRLSEDIMTRWKKHQGSIEDFYQKLSDEDARIFQKYTQ